MTTLSDITQGFQNMFFYSDRTQIKHLGSERNHSLFYSALDSLDDVAHGFHEFQYNKATPSIIECLGFMQGLYIQQDSVKVLAGVFGEKIEFHTIPKLHRIRDLRNRICGHPVEAETRHVPFSTSFIPRMGRTRNHFQAIIQYDGRWATETIKFKDIREDNENALAEQMLLIRSLAEEKESEMFRTEPYESLVGGKQANVREKSWRTESLNSQQIKPVKIDVSSWLYT